MFPVVLLNKLRGFAYHIMYYKTLKIWQRLTLTFKKRKYFPDGNRAERRKLAHSHFQKEQW